MRANGQDQFSHTVHYLPVDYYFMRYVLKRMSAKSEKITSEEDFF